MSSLEFLAVIVGACTGVFLAGFSLMLGIWAGLQTGRRLFGAWVTLHVWRGDRDTEGRAYGASRAWPVTQEQRD